MSAFSFAPEPERRAPAMNPTPQRVQAAEREGTLRIVTALERSHALLARSLDPDATVLSALEIVIPSLADWGVLHLTGEAGQPVLRQVLHADERGAELLGRLEHFPFTRSPPLRPTRASERGPRILTEVSEPMLAGLAVPSELELLRSLRPGSLAILPLFAGERACGALTLVVADSGRRYSRDDAPLLGLLADQIGLALHAAQSFSQVEQARCAAEERLSTLVHDLKNHLHSVRLAVAMLSAADPPAERLRSQLVVIERAIQSMDEQIAASRGKAPPAERS